METKAVEVQFKPEESLSNEGFFGRLAQLPFLNTTLNEASKLYYSTKERNILTKCSFAAVEVGTRMAFSTTKLAFKVMPDNLKTKIEENAQAVDDFACHGLDAIQKRFPIITQGPSEVLHAGSEAVEKSELVEVVLTVAESLLDCVPLHALEQQGANSNACPFRILPQKKLDRMKVIPRRTGRAVKYVTITGGQKIFWTVALLPLHATYLWIDGVKYLLSSTIAPVGTVLSQLPLVKSLVPVYPKLRRSKRRKVKVNYKRLLSKSPCPFPAISPDKKRKREGMLSFEGDDTSTYALYDDDNEYCSEEDPDYDPEKDEEAMTSDTTSSSSADSGEASDMDEVDVEGEAQSAHAQARVLQNEVAINVSVEASKILKRDENKNEKQALSDKAGSSIDKKSSSGEKAKLHNGEKAAEEKEENKKSFIPKANTEVRPSPDKNEKGSPKKSPSTKLTKPAFKSKTPPKVKSSPSENKENLAKAKSFQKGAESLKESKQAERDSTGKQLENATANSQAAKGKTERLIV